MSGVEGCDPTSGVHGKLSEFLGPQWREILPDGATIRVRVERAPATFVASVRATVEGQSLDRSLQSPDCDVLVSAVALVIAVAAEPIVTATRIESSRAPEAPASDRPRAPREPREAISEPPTAVPPPRSGRRIRPPAHWLRLAAGASDTPLPSPGAAVGLRYLAAWRYVGVGVELGYEAPREVSYDDGSQGVSLQAISLAASACPGLYAPKGHIGGCAGVRAAAIPTRPIRVPSPLRPVLGWVGAGLGVDAGWAPVPRIELGASVQGEVSLLRPAVDVVGRPTLYRASILGWQALVGVAFRLH